jgi:tetratricopeptide (TPR) repeat protein
MKSVKILLSVALAALGGMSFAQDFSDDAKYGKYGATAEERKENIYLVNFFNEAVGNQDYQTASGYLKQLLDKCPGASENIYAKGSTVMKNKIARAKSVSEKKVYVDSLMLLYDMRVVYFGNHPTRGKAYILDRKARDYFSYNPSDHEGVLTNFREAINEEATPELVAIYYKQLVDYYKEDGEGSPEDIIAEYDRLAPVFDGAEGQDADYKSLFDSCFGTSGVASCENLEKMFSEKIPASNYDATVLSQAVGMMTRAHCDSEFYLATAEKYYEVKPSSETALFLAQAFQNKQQYEKAIKYLNEALSVESDSAEKEKLLVRIGVVQLALKNYSKAREAALAAQAINAEDGMTYFVLAQCYASQASSSTIQTQAMYWVAYDTMDKASSLLTDADIKAQANRMKGAYRSAWPSKEECFFNEISVGQRFVVNGIATTVRCDK